MSTPLYDTDFYTWTREQAEALRTKNLAALDLDHLAEEIHDLGSNIEHAIESHLVRLLLHLLKLQYDPNPRPRRGWMASVASSRFEIGKYLRRNPGLQHHPTRELPDAYTHARRRFTLATGRPLTDLPDTCPWPIERVLDENFFPEA